MFKYKTAFSRNIGWITPEEQSLIKIAKIAIGGLGGAGGEHAITLARMGFENFHLSDFDEFEVHNFNRQAGAFVSTLGKNKCDVIADMILDINPEAKITKFPEGINESNVYEFFKGVDIYVDGIDFFALEARKLIYKVAEEKGIPNLLAAPLGLGMACIVFTKDSMKFDDYYKFSSCKTDEDFFLNLLVGLSPATLHKDYLVHRESANFKKKIAPSNPMAIKLCSGVLVSNVVKLVLDRGVVIKAPKVLQYDAYKNKLKISRSVFGNSGILQRIKLMIMKKMLV